MNYHEYAQNFGARGVPIVRFDWEWIGKHKSQRLYGISRMKAESLAERFGGVARHSRDA
jgi:hypothetical protein